MRVVEFSPMARRDLRRLQHWLEERAPHIIEEAVNVIVAASRSLGEFPDRGRSIRKDLRELVVPFGSAGYVLQYDVRPRLVIILRVFHALEDR